MNQYDLYQLWERLDECLKSQRIQLDVNAFALISIDKAGICLFEHRTNRMRLRFNCRKNKIVDWE